MKTAVLLFLSFPCLASISGALFVERAGDFGPAFEWRGKGARALLGSGATVVLESRRTTKLTFPGSSRHCVPRGERPSAARVNFYPGVAGARAFRQVRYPEVYPGIDLVFRSDGAGLEYDIVLHPGAKPDSIRIRFARGASLTESGDLEIGAGVHQKTPAVFQTIHGRATPVALRYERTADGSFSVHLGKYEQAAQVTIDPVLNFSAYLGGEGYEAVYGIATDPHGNIYVAGETDSARFGGSGRRNSRDAFVAKLDPSGSSLLYVTYLGGGDYDSANGIAVDASGNAFIAGVTRSIDFPVTAGSFSVSNSGREDAFVTKLDSSGRIVYSTYLGSSGSDAAYGIAVDGLGNAFVAGQTFSAGFRVLGGGFQSPTRGGTSDCFVAKLNPSGSGLAYSAVLGGKDLDACSGIAIDAQGNAYVTGTTYSADFPVVPGGAQTSFGGGTDAFVTKLDPSGATLVYSTFLGGTGPDFATSIAVDSSGAAYVAGTTASVNFPVTATALQRAAAGNFDAFAAKVTPDGKAFAYSTLFGGLSADTAMAISVDDAGRAIIAGQTNSPDLPLLGAIQTRLQSYDAFVAVIDATGASLVFSTYLGGTADDTALAVASRGGLIYVAGTTGSTDLPNVTLGPWTNGGYDGFVSKLTYPAAPVGPPQLLFVPVTPCRIADTRGYGTLGPGFGLPSMQGYSSRSFVVPSSSCGIPATAKAYSVNITVVPPGYLMYLLAWPTGGPPPVASTLNSFDGRVVANAAIVPAGTDGAISIFVTDRTDVIIDINGYFDTGNPQGLAFYPLTPCRVADTRAGYGFTGPFGSPSLSPSSSRDIPVQASSCAVPSSARAYSLNLTALPNTGYLMYMLAWPSDKPQPSASTLNSYTGVIVANAVIVPASAAGDVNVYATNPADAIVDINGYFAPPGAPGGLAYYPMTPCRISDTRGYGGLTGLLGPPSLAPNVARTIPVLSSSCGVPPAAQAYVLNVTAVPSGPLSFVAVLPVAQPYPTVSTLNSPAGQAIANMAIVPAGPGGSITLYATNRTDIILDIVGYFGK